MTLMTYVRDADERALFAVVVDGDDVTYVWPKAVAPWFDETRTERLAETLETPPEDEAGWLDLATSRLGSGVVIDHAYDDFNSSAKAVKTAQKVLDEPYKDPETVVVPNSGRAVAASDAFDQISQDYPGFAEDEDSFTPEAMLNYVQLVLGPIDPEGPNGWLIRAADGEPREGDEDEYVHWAVQSSQED